MLLFTQSAVKVFLFKKFYVLREKSNDIDFFLEHCVYSNINMYSALILVFLF